jgi:hypothetical protein
LQDLGSPTLLRRMFGVTILVLAVVLVHIGMGLLFFQSPFKIFRIFFFGDSQLNL